MKFTKQTPRLGKAVASYVGRRRQAPKGSFRRRQAAKALRRLKRNRPITALETSRATRSGFFRY